MAKKPATDWGSVARSASDRAHQYELETIKAELKAANNAHQETLRALESARLASTRCVKINKAPASKSAADDLVEVIFSDVHGNQHDPAAFGRLIQDLKIIRPDRIIIGGDFINCGGFLAEHHTMGYVADTEDSYEEDVKVSNLLLDEIIKAAPGAEIHYIEGNHEWRVERWAVNSKLAHFKDVELLRRTFAPEHVLRLKERGIAYYRQGLTHGDCTVPGWVKFDKINFVHKISNSSDAADVALSKAAGNIVYFDTHRASFKPKFKASLGLIAAWNPGCLCKRQPLYANTNPTEWTHGYLVRFISRKTGAFQMVNVTIDDGQSFASMLLKNRS
jgi:hypothetical protein